METFLITVGSVNIGLGFIQAIRNKFSEASYFTITGFWLFWIVAETMR